MESLATLHRRSGVAVLFALAAFSMGSVASAGELDAKTLSGLVSGQTWKAVKPAGPGYLYWAWSPDGTVCLREEKAGSCMDTGRWKLEGNSVCYELSWWGKSGGYDARCVRVGAKGDGRYEMIPVGGVTKTEFSIAD